MRSCLALTATLLLGACGLTVTNERPTYQELEPAERQAIDVILAELTAFNNQVKARTKYNIDQILNKEKIDVSFEQMIFAGNLGDEQVHVSIWENLSDAQRSIVQGWFKSPTLASAEQSYKKLFYRFMAVSQGVKQYMYNALQISWVFDHRSLFNVERDSVRTALAYYVAVGQKADMWTFVNNLCAGIKPQYASRYESLFVGDFAAAKKYLTENFFTLANPENPFGYMYFFCRWNDLGQEDTGDLTSELNWLRDLSSP